MNRSPWHARQKEQAMMGVQAARDEWFSYNVNLARRVRPLRAVFAGLPRDRK